MSLYPYSEEIGEPKGNCKALGENASSTYTAQRHEWTPNPVDARQQNLDLMAYLLYTVVYLMVPPTILSHSYPIKAGVLYPYQQRVGSAVGFHISQTGGTLES